MSCTSCAGLAIFGITDSYVVLATTVFGPIVLVRLLTRMRTLVVFVLPAHSCPPPPALPCTDTPQVLLPLLYNLWAREDFELLLPGGFFIPYLWVPRSGCIGCTFGGSWRGTVSSHAGAAALVPGHPPSSPPPTQDTAVDAVKVHVHEDSGALGPVQGPVQVLPASNGGHAALGDDGASVGAGTAPVPVQTSGIEHEGTIEPSTEASAAVSAVPTGDDVSRSMSMQSTGARAPPVTGGVVRPQRGAGRQGIDRQAGGTATPAVRNTWVVCSIIGVVCSLLGFAALSSVGFEGGWVGWAIAGMALATACVAAVLAEW